MAEGSAPVEGPRNKKGRPFGSGTTNQKRKELRKEKQWSYMEGADPTSPECLVKHLEALEKAKEKCQAKLKEKLQEAIDTVGPSSSASSSKPPEKKENAAQEAKRKVVLEKTGKMGSRKAQLISAGEVLEKTQKKEEEWVEVPEEVEEFEVVMKKTKVGWEEVVVPKTKVLEKSKVLEKTKPHKIAKKKDLEKSKRPVVVVDWHNTLEKDLQVTPRNLYALEMLADRCQVLVLSYVNSTWKENQVLELVSKLPQAHKLMGYQ